MYKAGDPTPFRAQVRHLSLDMELAVLDIVDCSAERKQQRQVQQQRRQRSSGRGSGSRLGRAPSQQSGGGAHQGSVNGADEADQGEDEEEEGEEEEEELDDVQRFWQGVRPLVLGDLPSVQQPVQASDSTGRGMLGDLPSVQRPVQASVSTGGVEGGGRGPAQCAAALYRQVIALAGGWKGTC